MRNKYILFFTVIVCLTFFSCAKKASVYDSGMTQNDTAMAPAASSAPSAITKSTRLMIRNAEMHIQVADVSKAVDSASSIVEKSGGYIYESQVYRDSSANMKLGVPAGRLAEILDSIAKLGVETSRHISSEDVTDQVVDMEAELANRKILRDRLRAILSKAKDVKDILAVEAELTRIQTEIDSIEGRLKKTRENIAFSKVSLYIQPKGPEKKQEILGPLGYLFYGAKWFVTKLFVIQSAD
jgi:hypothetical protein